MPLLLQKMSYPKILGWLLPLMMLWFRQDGLQKANREYQMISLMME